MVAPRQGVKEKIVAEYYSKGVEATRYNSSHVGEIAGTILNY